MGCYDLYLFRFFSVRSRALEHRVGTCFCPCSSFLFFLRIGPFFPGASLQHTRYVHPEHCQECGPCIEELDFSLCSWKSCGKFRISNDAFTKNSCFETVLIRKWVKHWNRPFPFHSISTRLIYGFLCIPAKKLKSHGSAMAWNSCSQRGAAAHAASSPSWVCNSASKELPLTASNSYGRSQA